MHPSVKLVTTLNAVVGVLPPLPEGYAFLTDNAGVYLTDGVGNYLIVPEA